MKETAAIARLPDVPCPFQHKVTSAGPHLKRVLTAIVDPCVLVLVATALEERALLCRVCLIALVTPHFDAIAASRSVADATVVTGGSVAQTDMVACGSVAQTDMAACRSIAEAAIAIGGSISKAAVGGKVAASGPIAEAAVSA